MYSIAHVLPYFINGTGKWPDYIDWYLASCEKNETIDYYIFTDDIDSLDKWKNVKNIHIFFMTFDECTKLIHEKIGNVKITKPYKLCDLKPVFGKVFEDWVKKYDFWAFGDCDLIFGDIRAYFPDSFLNQYDRLQVLGNFQLTRNTEEVNNHYLLKRPDWSLYKDFTWDKVINTEENLAFDEWEGLPLIVRENGKRIYWTRENFANIYQPWKYKKMLDNTVQENTLFQYWIWENGKIFHVDALTGKRKERLYIHMSSRKMDTVPYNNQNKVYITVNSQIKDNICFKDTFCGFDFFVVYSKKIMEWIIWHLKHPFGKDKAEA